jgi:hypothetical protein
MRSGDVRALFNILPAGSKRVVHEPSATLRAFRFYQARRASVVEFAGSRYTFTAGSLFAFLCVGAVGTPDVTAAQLASGSVTVSAPRGHLGGGFTDEALTDPASVAATSLVVTRRAAGADVRWLTAHELAFHAGTTTVRRIAGGKVLRVAPQVGPQAGVCQHVTAARISIYKPGRGTVSLTR